MLGPDVDIEIEAYDECNTVIDVKGAIASAFARPAAASSAWSACSRTSFRARSISAAQFRAAGVPVVIGGFHVSGCLSMLPELPPDLKEALDLGITLFAGEAEGRMADAAARHRQRHGASRSTIISTTCPTWRAATLPILPRRVVTRVAGHYASFDAGRGCPFQCSFCTIINVQGRKSRYRTADDVEAIVRANAAQGVTRFFVTDDNFARNRNWEADPRPADRAARAATASRSSCSCRSTRSATASRASSRRRRAPAATRVFIGLENINPESLIGAKKRQNKIWEYREMLQAWRSAKVMTWAGYILGFPTDTPESIARDIEIIKKELPIDILEFFFLTPLPGSEDHKKLLTQGRPDGPRHEQVRSRACLHRPSRDVEGDLGSGLSRRLGALLHRRACRDDHAARGRDRHQPQQGSRRC